MRKQHWTWDEDEGEVMDTAPIQREHHTLRKLHVFNSAAIDVNLDQYDFVDPKFSTRVIQDHARQMLLELQAYVWTEDLGEHIILPGRWASWWDHLRADHFPSWVNRRWPPKKLETNIKARIKALYPKFKFVHPDPSIRVETFSGLT